MKLKRLHLALVAVAAIAAVVACNSGGGKQPLEVTKGLVIQHVTIVNTRDGSLSPDMAVVIDAGKIQQVVAVGVNVSGTAQLVDGTGKFLVPGFNDMHIHMFDAPDAQTLNANYQLLVANGITGFREMSGSAALVQQVQQLNADNAAGRIIGPEALTVPGDLFVGAPPVSTVTSAAIAAVQAQKTYGAQFIKVVSMNRDVTQAVLSEAKNQGLYVAGHLSPFFSAKEASDGGWRAIEHLGSGIGILLDCASQEADVRAALQRGDGGVTVPLLPAWSATNGNAPFFQRVDSSYDNTKCTTLMQTFVKNGTWNTPTLIKNRTGFYLDEAASRTDPNLIYVSKTTRAAWDVAANAFPVNLSAASIAIFRQHFVLHQQVTKLLKQAAAKMMAGSDVSLTRSPWQVPGFSLHNEFKLLAASGLSPLEVLQMTTINAADFLNRTATMGTVEAGKNADLVLLDANPIADVANLDAVSGVFLKGSYFSKSALDLLKTNIANTFATVPLNSAQLSLYHAHID